MRNLNPLIKEVLSLTKILDENGIYSWFTYAKTVTEETKIDLNEINNCQSLKETKQKKQNIKNNINTYYVNLIENKINTLIDKNKIYLYKFIKSAYSMEYYLSHPNKESRKYLTKFRLSDHDLLIEIGRFKKIPREERTCKTCNKIDDEYHFFFDCCINDIQRKLFLQHFITCDENFNNLKSFEKLNKILNPSTPKDINIVVSFIKQSLELRGRDS